VKSIRLGRILSVVFVGAVLVFQMAPLMPVIISSFSSGNFVRFPPEGFSLQWYPNIPAKFWRALGVSLEVAGLTAFFTCLLGVPATFGLIRGNCPGRNFIRAFFMSPLQVPLVVSGLVFMQFYFWIVRNLKMTLLGSLSGLTIAHVILCLPFVIGTLGPVLQRFDNALEEAALSLGASRWRTIKRVTLPVISPGIFSSAMFAFIASFCDMAATVFIVSTRTMTLPVEIFYAMEFDMRPDILAISTVVIVLSAVVVKLLHRFIGASDKNPTRFGG
jgi:putative spermidine/putrescine transport system permease protein